MNKNVVTLMILLFGVFAIFTSCNQQTKTEVSENDVPETDTLSEIQKKSVGVYFH